MDKILNLCHDHPLIIAIVGFYMSAEEDFDDVADKKVQYIYDYAIKAAIKTSQDDLKKEGSALFDAMVAAVSVAEENLGDDDLDTRQV